MVRFNKRRVPLLRNETEACIKPMAEQEKGSQMKHALVLLLFLCGCNRNPYSSENSGKPEPLRLTEKGLQFVDTPFGEILVIFDKVEPHSGGYRVRARIGNPLEAEISGLTLTVAWHPITKPQLPSLWNQKICNIPETIGAGHWAIVDFTLQPMSASDFEGPVIVNVTVRTVENHPPPPFDHPTRIPSKLPRTR